MEPRIRSANADDALWIDGFLRRRWSATRIAIHGQIIEAANLPALVADHRRGLATYRRLGSDAELVTLDADPVGVGTGTAIIEALAVRLRAENCERLWLTTTNDKLSALRFYLRRGFRIIQVRLGAVEAVRKLKPSIPMVGEYGISIQDELDLCRAIGARATRNTSPLPPWSQLTEATDRS